MDYISDLPQSIIEIILTLLPIRDAVRTCMLSSKWRYRWTTLSNLVFDDNCAIMYDDIELLTNSHKNFITRTLFLHQGPIHKFHLYGARLHLCPDIERWVIFLSTGDLKELVLKSGEWEWFTIPSCLYNCKKLTRLELSQCELDPPSAFKGFLWLKSLSLHRVLVAPEAIESFISSCPLLENFSLCPDHYLVLNVRAPNLRYLCLEGEFEDICLENTPLLVDVSVNMYTPDDPDDIFEIFGQSSSCNVIKFFGGAPRLGKLIGDDFFIKYLSIGDYQGMRPITCSCLKVIELYGDNFGDMEEIPVLLHLITNSPYLKELQISASSNPLAATEAPDLDFWEKRCLKGCTFKYLKVVKMIDMSSVRHEMEFIKFLLANSPVLEMMSISPVKANSLVLEMMSISPVKNGRLDTLIELLQFQRASAQAEIFFIQD